MGSNKGSFDGALLETIIMVGVCPVGSLDTADRASPSSRQVPECFRPPSEKIIIPKKMEGEGEGEGEGIWKLETSQRA